MHDDNYDSAEFGGLFSGIANFVSNAVSSAGREIGKAASNIKKIPIVGAPVHTVFNAAYHAATAPVKMAVDVGIHGKRIDKAALDTVKTAVSDVKAVAPYAQTVVSVLPGVGTVVSGGLGAGLALASGQPIDKALIAGIQASIPGGPLAKTVFDIAHQGITSAATGKRFDFVHAATHALSEGAKGLGLPPAAAQALATGLNMTGEIAHGKRIDDAIVKAAIDSIPASPQVKNAMTSASALSLALAQGKPVDSTVLNQVKTLSSFIPIPKDFEKSVNEIVKKGGNPSTALAVVLHGGIAEGLINHGSKSLPKQVQNAIKSGVAVGSGVVHQTLRGNQLGQVHGKLIESGIQLSKTLPNVASIRKLVGSKGAKGFDIATGLMSQRVNTFDVMKIRNSLNPTERKAFDMALALRTGLVTKPVNSKLSPAAQAGEAVMHGMKGNSKSNTHSVLKTLKTHPSTAVGAAVAEKQIIEEHRNWIARLLNALGIK